MSKSSKVRRVLLTAGLTAGLWSAGAAATNQSASAGPSEMTCLDLSSISVSLGAIKWDPSLGESCYATPVAQLIEDVLDLIGRGYSPAG